MCNNPKQSAVCSDPESSSRQLVTFGVGTGSLHIDHSTGALRMVGVTRFTTVSTAALPLRGDCRVVRQRLSLLALAAAARVPAGNRTCSFNKWNGTTQHRMFYSQRLSQYCLNDILPWVSNLTQNGTYVFQAGPTSHLVCPCSLVLFLLIAFLVFQSQRSHFLISVCAATNFHMTTQSKCQAKIKLVPENWSTSTLFSTPGPSPGTPLTCCSYLPSFLT